MKKSIAHLKNRTNALAAAVKDNSGIQYGASILIMALKSFFLAVFTGALIFFSLQTLKWLWHLYTATPVGRKFMELHPEPSGAIADIFSHNLFLLSGELSLTAVLICLAAGAVLQAGGLFRALYRSRGTMGRMIFIAAPLCAAVAWELDTSLDFKNYKTACLMGAVPTLSVYKKCLGYAEQVVPELTNVIAEIKERGHALLKTIYKP